MREIKFKAWDKKNKRMLKVRDICNMNRDYATWVIKCEDEKYNDILLDGVDVEIMQFTGLKDKNGKEIYESDILKWITIGEEGGNFEDIGVKKESGNYEVIFENGKFTTTKPNIPIGHINKKCEIMGNKFENPELLE